MTTITTDVWASAEDKIAAAGAEAMAMVHELTPNGLEVFMLRYSRKDAAGNPTESVPEVEWRVNLNVASVTVLYVSGAEWEEGDPEPSVVDAASVPFPFRHIVRKYNWLLSHGTKLKEFSAVVYNGLDAWLERAQLYYRELFASGNYISNSPTFTGSGTPLQQLAACFVLPINDTLVEGEANIMQTLRDAVAIQKTGGGNGFSFGRLRPAGSRVFTSMGEATGVVGFLGMFNGVFEQIRQGGSRRGANMGVCPVWHPDLPYFMDAKTKEDQNRNFNISVGITAAFMEAVEADGQWEFHFPGPDGPVMPVEWDGEMVNAVSARELFSRIAGKAWMKGDPGALFLDEANRYNPCPAQYELESTNPCGEQWLGPYENCCLGHLAVQRFVREDGTYDWDRFREIIELATEFLDDVVDANGYVPSVPQLEEAAENGRRIGLGQMGLADALVKVGVRYGAADGMDFASQLTEFMRFHAMLASARRAGERGPFRWIEESIYDPDLMRKLGAGAEYSTRRVTDGRDITAHLWAPPTPLFPQLRDFGRPRLNWGEVVEAITLYGIRNSCQSTFAPTGATATAAGVEGYGCESFYALSYTRTVMQEHEHVILHYLSDLFKEALGRSGLTQEVQDRILEQLVANKGSCQDIEEVPAEIRRIFPVAADLSGEEHVRMQAVLQAFIDNSISKTINFPYEATAEDVRNAYHLAWQLKCKGITIYRQGSRDLEVLSASNADVAHLDLDSNYWPLVTPLAIPVTAEAEGLPSRTFTERTPFGKVRVTFTHLSSHPERIFDMSAGLGRAGNDVNAFTEAIGRLVSLSLRAGLDPRVVADQLIGIGGATREETLRPDKSLSLPDALGKLLHRYALTLSSAEVDAAGNIEVVVAQKGEVDLTKLCPECHQATILHAQGCINCTNCGYSKC